jgi:hypothetical protein
MIGTETPQTPEPPEPPDEGNEADIVKEETAPDDRGDILKEDEPVPSMAVPPDDGDAGVDRPEGPIDPALDEQVGDADDDMPELEGE